MADFGTLEYYENEVHNYRIEKVILISALKHIIKNETESLQDAVVIDKILDKLHYTNMWIEDYSAKIKELLLQKGKSE